MAIKSRVASKADIGLGNVDNTSDANKPVSTAQQAAIDAKVSKSSVGAPNGVPSLGPDGKVVGWQLPDGSAGTVSTSNITDATAAGRALLTAPDAETQKTALGVTKVDVGLANVDNTSDANKPLSTAAQQALSGKAPTAHSHSASQITDATPAGKAMLTAASAAAQKAALGITKSDVGLSSVDNTSDANKPLSTAAQQALSGKAPMSHTHSSAQITDATPAGRAVLTAADAAAQKSALGLVKGDVGLGNVDNTADANKPVSAPQAAAIQSVRLIFGAGAPSGAIGSDSQFYLDTSSDRLYGPKTSGAWPSKFFALSGGGVNTDVAPVNTVAPAISGGSTTGQTFTATPGSWTGSPTPTFAYQWFRGPTPSGSFDPTALTLINNAVGSSYTSTVADIGFVLYVKVTGSNNAGSSFAYSIATSIISAPVAQVPVNTSLPTINGAGEVGSTLFASTGSWTNNPASYTYQWLRDGSPISNATSTSYVLTESDLGAKISVSVTATNSSGSSDPSTSLQTGTIVSAPVAVPVLVSPPVISGGTTKNSALASTRAVWSESTIPSNTALPTITGTATEGEVLSASNGSWTNTPNSYAYQWRRNGTAITGATSNTYTLVSADVGATITVAVVAINDSGSSAPAISNPTAAVAAAAAAGPGAAITWNGPGSNAFSWDPSVAFPGDGRTIVANSGMHDGVESVGTRAVSDRAIINKTYFELKVNARGGDAAFGLTDPSYDSGDISYYVGGDFHTPHIGWRSTDGRLASNFENTIYGNIDFPTTGQTMCWAIDKPSGKFWVRVNNGPWNGDASANPATGTGGWDLVNEALRPHWRWDSGALTDSATLNVTSDTWTYAAPSGFTANP